MSNEDGSLPRTYPVPDEVADVAAAALHGPSVADDPHQVTEFELEAARKYLVDGEITSDDAQAYHKVLVASAADSTVFRLLGGTPARAWLGLLLNEIEAGGDGMEAITAAGMRRVRTAKGARFYRLPVGAPIVKKPRTRKPKSGSSSSKSGQVRIPTPKSSAGGAKPPKQGTRSSTSQAAPGTPRPKVGPAGSNKGSAKPKNPGTKPTSSSDAGDLQDKIKNELDKSKSKDERPYDAGIYWDGHTRRAKEHEDKARKRPNGRDVLNGANGAGGLLNGLGKPKAPKGKNPSSGTLPKGSTGAKSSGGSGSTGEAKSGKALPGIEKVAPGRTPKRSTSIPDARKGKPKKGNGLNQADTDHGGKMVKLHGDETRSYGLKDAKRGLRNESVDANPGIKEGNRLSELKKRFEQRRIEDIRARLRARENGRSKKS